VIFLGFIGDIFNLVISTPLGFILRICYSLVKNYGLALFLFTLVTRLILFPLAIKQQRSTAQMARLRPMMDKLQKKHGKDKEKYNAELTKLYQQEGYNPLSGCLPLLIQLPILFGLFSVVYNPLTYILSLPKATIIQIRNVLKPELIHIYGKSVIDAADKANRLELYLSNHLNSASVHALPGLSHLSSINYNFFGLDLSQQPSFDFNHISVLWLIPILSAISAYFSSSFSMKLNAVATPQTAGMNKTMLMIMPFFSAYIAFTVPAGIGLYWIFTNLIMLLQTYILSVFYHPTALAEKIDAEMKLKREKLGIVEVPEPEIIEESPAKPNLGNKTGNTGSKRSVKKYNRDRLSKSRLKDE
jgi:YidC/Oxa1 family membrane protein insertase